MRHIPQPFISYTIFSIFPSKADFILPFPLESGPVQDHGKLTTGCMSFIADLRDDIYCFHLQIEGYNSYQHCKLLRNIQIHRAGQRCFCFLGVISNLSYLQLAVLVAVIATYLQAEAVNSIPQVFYEGIQPVVSFS